MTIAWTKPTTFGIKWDNGPNQPASPLIEIDRDEFLRLYFCGAWGLDGLNFGGSAPLPDKPKDRENWYRWQYFFFHRYALAIATKYGDKPEDSQCYLPPKKYESGYDLKFYRLGCLHPNLKSDWVALHNRRDVCPDCGFTAQYDTSG
jgi:hypothetical protein